MRSTPSRRPLIGLWLLAAAVLIAAVAVSWQLGSLQHELFNPQEAAADSVGEQQRWLVLQVLQSVVTALALIVAVVPMIALAAHAVRWELVRRSAESQARLSPGSRP